MSNVDRFAIADEDYKPQPVAWRRTYKKDNVDRLVTNIDELSRHLNERYPGLNLDQAYWAFVSDVTPEEVASMPYQLRDELMELEYILPS